MAVSGNALETAEVPAGLFRSGQPPFVLFDRAGRVADLQVARRVYVAPSDVPALHSFLRHRLAAIVGSRTLGSGDRAWAVLRVLTADAASALQRMPDQSGALDRLVATVSATVNDVAADPPPYLAELARSQRGFASCSVATGCYSVALGAVEGLDDRDSLLALMLGGICADAAALRMEVEIPDEGRALTDAQRATVESHPALAAELLVRSGVRAARVLGAIRSHHERWDGAGYPHRLAGVVTPIEARIVAIADAYARLTSEQPHRGALTSYDALLTMARDEGHFEPRLLRAFVRALGGPAVPREQSALPDRGGVDGRRNDGAAA
jgi:HD-GYP domain-containing protein (c-di-GMP phosphodiesterase class II)